MTIKSAHFHEPHLYLWQLAVDPPAQRSGVGRALMQRVIADANDASVPVYLETAKPENVPDYRSLGFVETGREKLPRGAPLWLMLRPHRRHVASAATPSPLPLRIDQQHAW